MAWAPDFIDLAHWSQRLAGRFVVVAESAKSLRVSATSKSMAISIIFNVHADHQRRGVGTALLAALEEEARRRCLTSLHTEASITARPFFERQGFFTLQGTNREMS